MSFDPFDSTSSSDAGKWLEKKTWQEMSWQERAEELSVENGRLARELEAYRFKFAQLHDIYSYSLVGM